MNNVADTLYSTGFWLLEQERPHDAVHVFRTMLALAPSDERGWLALGESHERMNEVDKSTRLYRLGVAACGGSARLLVAFARAARKLGRDEQSLESYDQAFEIALERDDEQLVRIIEAERSAA